jgi:hypothetical protein
MAPKKKKRREEGSSEKSSDKGGVAEEPLASGDSAGPGIVPATSALPDPISCTFHVNATVRISGLKAAQYNGLVATVLIPPEGTGRVTVRTTTAPGIAGFLGKTLALQQVNLTLLATAAQQQTSAAHHAKWRGPAPVVEDLAIIQCCVNGDLRKLRQYGKQGVRLRSAWPLNYCASGGLPNDVIRCLVQDLGADIHQKTSGSTAMYVHAHTHTHTHTHKHAHSTHVATHIH